MTWSGFEVSTGWPSVGTGTGRTPRASAVVSLVGYVAFKAIEPNFADVI